MNQESLTTFTVPDFASSMPAMDRASPEGLSKDEVRAWALRKSEEYRLLSYAMLSLHNDAAPIHSLPVELPMKIFGMTWSLKGRLSPTSVCRRWHTVYQSTRAFWTEILAELLFVQGNDEWSWTWRLLRQPSLELVTALLDKSSPHPFPLSIVQTFDEAPTLPPYVFSSTVYTHLRHVVNINIDTTLLHLHDMYRVLNAGMPTLEILDIRASEAEPPSLARTLASLCPVADESLPRLYCLRLDPAIFFPLIASLKDIYLDSFKAVDGTVPWPHPASSNSRSLLRALSRCHNLECLRLEDFNYSRWWPPLTCLGRIHERSGTVQLPSLKKLSLGCEMWLPCAKAVLAALDPCIPPTASLVQLGYDDPESLSILIPSHLVQHHPFDTVLISRSCVRASDIRCFAAQSLRLDIQFGSPRNLADLGIDSVFRTAHVTRLEIIHHLDTYGDQYAMATGMPVEDWAAVLRTFSHLTHLTVSGANAPSDVVDALGAVAAGHRGVAADSGVLASRSDGPTCPGLRYLTLGWEVPREITPANMVEPCDRTAYYLQHQDVGTRVEQRCSAMQLAFERRRSIDAQNLDGLEFYECEKQGYGHEPFGDVELGELIVSSRRDHKDLPCLERLRTVVGGPVVYRGYLLKTVVQPPINV